MSRRGSQSSDEGLWGSLEGTPLETTDLTFPSMALPPGRFRINNRKTLEHHLRQSPLLFQAYSEGFCVSNVFEDDDSVDFQVLQQWGRDYDVDDALSCFEPAVSEALHLAAKKLLLQLFVNEDADLVGIMFLNEIFSGWLMIHPDSSDVKELFKMFQQAVRGLEAKERPAPVPGTVFAQGLDTAFDAVFMDPHDMVSYYAHELQRLWRVWSENPTQYIAPYTSIVTSSMMGKSRLMKEMASFIPTIYICLRETGESGRQVEGERFVDAYPERSPDKVINYLFNEPQRTGSGDIKRHYVCFFIGVLEAMAFWVHSVITESTPGEESVIDINKRLWRTLAEPSTAVTEWSTKFWTIAINRARKFYAASEDSRSLQNLVRSNWENLRIFLKGLNMLGDGPVPLLFFVFDEARPLVKFGPNRKILHEDEETSRFSLLRRALQEVAMSRFQHEGGSGPGNEPIGIFTIFMDTTSKITDFQPGRKASRKHGNDLFPPIVILPTFDYHAKYRLQITNDPTEVAKPERLFHFGRAAWYSMLQSGTPYKTLVHLAAAKLTRKDASSLPKFFENDPLDEESRLVMLALMGPRLALQTGSFTALLPEMVSSHLMILMRVSDDHEQLEAFYASEPILAEASSSITAVYGWERPCQAMVALFRHGMVDKGFRVEFVTKALCCIAFEDACREMNEKADQGEVKEELDYSKAIPVFSFLDRLLHNPDSELPTDGDGDDGIDGGQTPIPSSKPEKEPKKGRSEIPEVDETDQIVQPDSSTTSKRKRDDISKDSTEETKTRKKTSKKKQPKKQPKKAGSTKRRKPTYDNPTEEPADDFFDDWDSDEEDFPYIRGKDTIPVRDESNGIYEYLLRTLSGWHDTRPQSKLATQTSTDSGLSGYDKALEDLDVLKNGTVFVTHFVAITTKLRPSILVKAWNRGVGIMTTANTEGIDFVIPVMLDRECKGFGPLYGLWTLEQERAASLAVGYILIDAKNDASLSENDITIQAMKCVPSGANIRFHEPMNPFITIIASYGSSDPKMPVKLVRDATIDTEPTQLALNAQGLSGATFKCLEERPNLTRILKAILEMDHNPLRGSGRDYEGVRKTTREFHPLALHPGREDDLFGQLGDVE